MEQHPIPRQITTFEFKLIGFLTLKQFIYLLVFSVLAYLIYYVFPIPVLNILLAILCEGVGLILALVPIYDRPADLWIKNIYKRLVSPTQFLYKKHNPPIYFFNNLFFLNDPHRVVAHIESQEKLTAYLAKVQAANQSQTNNNRRIAIKQQLSTGIKPIVIKNQSTVPLNPSDSQQPIIQQSLNTNPQPPVNSNIGISNQTQNLDNQNIKSSAIDNQQTPTPLRPTKQDSAGQATSVRAPFLTGIVKNHRLIPLPGILIYIKDLNNKTLRLLKSNPHGVFATFNPLSPGDYQFEIKDPKGGYLFDTMKISLNTNNSKPLEFFSKELI
jgi:hypothetical protein